MQENNVANDDIMPGLFARDAVPVAVPDDPVLRNEAPVQRNNVRDHQRMPNCLIQENLNVPGGYICFACTVSGGSTCIWDECSEDLIKEGDKAFNFLDANDSEIDLATKHSAACYACYCKYIYTVSSWSPG